MFKFMKSKKGFTLVELMIVVVIMAILVAVAVPIFNSVTGNARAKTCIDNQRTIISTINSALLENPLKTAKTETFIIETDEDGEGSFATNSNEVYNPTLLGKLFQTVPYCPEDGNDVEVTITEDDDGFTTILTECSNAEHVLSKS